MKSITQGRVEQGLIEKCHLRAGIKGWEDMVVDLDRVRAIAWAFGTVYTHKGTIEAEVQCRACLLGEGVCGLGILVKKRVIRRRTTLPSIGVYERRAGVLEKLGESGHRDSVPWNVRKGGRSDRTLQAMLSLLSLG